MHDRSMKKLLLYLVHVRVRAWGSEAIVSLGPHQRDGSLKLLQTASLNETDEMVTVDRLFRRHGRPVPEISPDDDAFPTLATVAWHENVEERVAYVEVMRAFVPSAWYTVPAPTDPSWRIHANNASNETGLQDYFDAPAAWSLYRCDAASLDLFCSASQCQKGSPLARTFPITSLSRGGDSRMPAPTRSADMRQPSRYRGLAARPLVPGRTTWSRWLATA